jgi:hypothetical protein
MVEAIEVVDLRRPLVSQQIVSRGPRSSHHLCRVLPALIAIGGGCAIVELWLCQERGHLRIVERTW